MNEKSKVAVRITDQYRQRDIMTYELICEGTRLVVRFFPRASETDSSDWCAEVRTNEKVDALVVTGNGETRGDALRDAGKAWGNALRGRPYAAFEWSGVVDVLTAVRAL